ncbi:hypothetical protein CMV_026644, partial [Castanea mollissima]
DDIDFIRFLV